MTTFNSNSAVSRANQFTSSYPLALDPRRLAKRKVCLIIMATIIFPVGILWVIKTVCMSAAIALANRAYKGCGGVKGTILPATHQYAKDPRKYIDIAQNGCNYQTIKRDATQALLQDSQSNKKLETFTLKTPDGVKLAAAVAWGNGDQKARFQPDSKWVILFNGNMNLYEHYLTQSGVNLKHYTDQNINVLMFNYRGLMDSEGEMQTTQDLVIDGHTALQFLLQQGIPAKQIVLEGASLGGGVSAQVAALVPDVNVANLNSFSSIHGVMHGSLECELGPYRSPAGNKIKPKGKRRFCVSIMARVISGCIKATLNHANLNLDTLSVWPKIRGHKWIITSTADEIMIDQGTLSKALKRQQPGYKKVINKQDPSMAAQLAQNQKIKDSLRLIKSRNTGHCQTSPQAFAQHLNYIAQAFAQ